MSDSINLNNPTISSNIDGGGGVSVQSNENQNPFTTGRTINTKLKKNSFSY